MRTASRLSEPPPLPKPSRGLIICETTTSTWHYHLRELPEKGPQYSGIVGGTGLCGKPVGWDVKAPINTWGRWNNLPEHYCQECLHRAVLLLEQVDFIRAAGNVQCSCGELYRDHPYAYIGADGEGLLQRICDGTIVKL